MQLEIKHGNILEEPADLLICSSNIYLNQSGGVGGEILIVYGDAMQKELHLYLRSHNLEFVRQGDVVRTDGCGTKFKNVLHAVAVDAWYKSSEEIVSGLLQCAFQEAAKLGGAKSVAVVALGTGYGPLTMKEFAKALKTSLRDVRTPIEKISVIVRKEDEAKEIKTWCDLGLKG